ncbi:glutamate--cysteine ligase [Theileria orientalis]|uniref:Glutamate--cysteine ligase n=1 Tax=Theileria orientalis TaxID=68886 RepID=A0A976M675_THEOR|nr:glutamate--cysteine ligase [Theileria orientalis]
MVYLRSGSTIDYDSICKISGMLRQLATLEFVNIYYQNLNRCDPVYLFGDEIEYLVVNLDHSNFKPRLLPIYPHISKFIQNGDHLNPNNLTSVSHLLNSNDEPSPNHTGYNRKEISFNVEDIGLEKTIVTPEYASYMIECIPDHPYSLFSNYVNDVRKSLHDRRKRLELILLMLGYNHSKVTTLTNFLRLGCEDCVYVGDEEFRKPLTGDLNGFLSNLFPDICVSPFSRFLKITENIGKRRRGTRIYAKKFVKVSNEDPLTKDEDFKDYDDENTAFNGVTLTLDSSISLDKFLDKVNNFSLFPLLSEKQQNLAKKILKTSYNGLVDTNNVDGELLSHIVQGVYSNDPMTFVDTKGLTNYLTKASINFVSNSSGDGASNSTCMDIPHDDVTDFSITSVYSNCNTTPYADSLTSENISFPKLTITDVSGTFDSTNSIKTTITALNSDNSSINDDSTNENPSFDVKNPQNKFKDDYNLLSNCYENLIFMDTTGFGMGMCCLQVTFSCCNLDEARYLYDQLLVLSPIFLSLSSATVGYRGFLADSDNRWSVLVQAMDDLNEDREIVKKSRYSTSSLYISNSQFCLENYKYLNDIPVASDFDCFIHLIKFGIDPILARHISHKMVYQPLVVYEENFGLVNCDETDMHYQIFHATNWTSVRLNHPKYVESHPYSTDSKPEKIPWRVEFRPLDIQLTDEENSMFICVVSYVVKVLLLKRLNLYMPISLVDINTEVSSKIESCHRDLFYFRENVTNNKLSVKKFSLHDILFGQVGLFKIVMDHLEKELNSGDVSKEFRDQLVKYLKHFEQLTLGNAPTNATKLRRFIQTHPTYSGDGTISDQILYDIIQNLTSY